MPLQTRISGRRRQNGRSTRSARPLRRDWVDAVEVVDDLLNGAKEPIEIEAVESHLVSFKYAKAVIALAHPPYEVEHHSVAPHPGWKALEAAQGLLSSLVAAVAAHEPVHPVSVGPIRLDSHGAESLFLDEPLRDTGALGVELVGAMGCFAQQHEGRISYKIDQLVPALPGACHRLELPANGGHLKAILTRTWFRSYSPRLPQ